MTETTVNSLTAGTVADDVLLELEDLQKNYGDNRILAGVDFSICRGEFVCVVGPSGSGKTTLLRCMAGLLEPSRRPTVFEGEDVTEPPAKLAVVFQDYSRSLLPWMTVERNIELPMRNKFSKAERGDGSEALDAVGLAGQGRTCTRGRCPAVCSSAPPSPAAWPTSRDVLLMDEPFAAVDAQTRIDLEDLVLKVRESSTPPSCSSRTTSTRRSTSGDRVIVLSGAPTTVSENIQVPCRTRGTK